MDEDVIPLFTPGAQRAIKKKRRPTKEIALPVRHPSREIAIREMPIDIDYHFFTPGVQCLVIHAQSLMIRCPQRNVDRNII
jgi:hypothetical protein